MKIALKITTKNYTVSPNKKLIVISNTELVDIIETNSYDVEVIGIPQDIK